MMLLRLTLESLDYHRNGVEGRGFYVVKFHDAENGPMLAIVFPDYLPDGATIDRTTNPSVAVFNRDKLKADDVRFFHNSWRGDHYAPWLFDQIAADHA